MPGDSGTDCETITQAGCIRFAALYFSLIASIIQTVKQLSLYALLAAIAIFIAGQRPVVVQSQQTPLATPPASPIATATAQTPDAPSPPTAVELPLLVWIALGLLLGGVIVFVVQRTSSDDLQT